MPLESFSIQLPRNPLGTVFVSSSIPDPERWDGEYEALEITDAVVALARVFLTAGYRIVTAAHPTIAPLLLYVAAEFPRDALKGRVIVYQSRLFEDVLPAATHRFEESGIAELQWTQAAEGERPQAGHWDKSLLLMRRELLIETEPMAACFIGGMEGVVDEHRLFRQFRGNRPTYPVGRPGGEARSLVDDAELTSEMHELLLMEDSYPVLWRAVVKDLESRV